MPMFKKIVNMEINIQRTLSYRKVVKVIKLKIYKFRNSNKKKKRRKLIIIYNCYSKRCKNNKSCNNSNINKKVFIIKSLKLLMILDKIETKIKIIKLSKQIHKILKSKFISMTMTEVKTIMKKHSELKTIIIFSNNYFSRFKIKIKTTLL